MSKDKHGQWEGGKGSYRRAENVEAYSEGWDAIFGNNEEPTQEEQPVEESQTDRFLRHMEPIKRLQDVK